MMTEQELEQAILDLIVELYEKEYTGKIKVTALKSNNNIIGYNLKLGLNRDFRPYEIIREGDAKTFLKFVKEELRSANFGSMNFYNGTRKYAYEEGEK